MTGHAFLAPSASARWVRCALSASLEAAYPESEASPESLEGTAAHWAVQMLLQGVAISEGSQAPNGIAITDEMLQAAIVVRDDIRAQLGPDWSERLFVEHRVEIPRVHPQNWGTPDYFAWGRLGDGRLKLWIWDFKFGHEVVEAFENWQLIDYTAGCLSHAKIDGLGEQNVVVDMRVIQPRAHHRDGIVRNWMVIASDLRTYWNRLEMAADDATSTTPTCTPHPEACKNCNGRHACEGLQRAAYWAADYGQKSGAINLPPHALGLELRALKRAQALLNARVTGLESEVEATIKRRERVPFWILESSPGRLSWTQPNSAVLAYGEMLGLKLAKPTEPITPTQAKALAKAAQLPESLIDAFASRPSSAAKLTYDDGTKARLTFASSVA